MYQHLQGESYTILKGKFNNKVVAKCSHNCWPIETVELTQLMVIAWTTCAHAMFQSITYIFNLINDSVPLIFLLERLNDKP